MKKNRIFLLLFLKLWVHQGSSQHALKEWETLVNMKEMVDYFSGTFERLSVHVDSTHEYFTVVSHGDRFSLVPGKDSVDSDYEIRIRPENIRNLKRYAADGKIDGKEAYRIQSVIFTPISQSIFSKSVMSHPGFVRRSGAEDHIHVYLIGPDTMGSTAHTIMWVNRQWLVVPGVYGRAKRVFKLNAGQALEYQRRIFRAQKANTKKAWKDFLRWYGPWKDTVSSPES